MLDAVGSSGYTACMATGNLKKYSIVIGIIAAFEFPLTWLFFAAGSSIVVTYYIYICVKVVVLIARMFLLKEMTGLKPQMYITQVFMPIFKVTVLALIPSIMLIHFMETSYLRLFLSVLTGILSVGLMSFFVGMDANERNKIISRINKYTAKFKRYRWIF